LTDRTEAQPSQAHDIPCTWKPISECEDCPIQGELMCRFETIDLVTFLMIFLPFAVAVIGGVIRAGYGRYLLFWLAYSLLFFFVWEARILCRHCPMWAEEGRILHCHANHGVFKIWKYEPGPMSRWEQIQFIVGALLWIGFPFVFLVMGKEYLLGLVGMSAVVGGVFSLRRFVCSRCINFSCPINTVRKEYVDAYLERNPEIRAAWERSGYRLGGQ